MGIWGRKRRDRLAAVAVLILVGLGWVTLCGPGSVTGQSDSFARLSAGQLAPGLDRADAVRHPVEQSDRIVVFVCGCSACRIAIEKLNTFVSTRDRVALTAVFHGQGEQAAHIRRKVGGARLVLDPTGQLHSRWKVDQCPSMFAVSRDGTIVAVEEAGSSAQVAPAVERLKREMEQHGLVDSAMSQGDVTGSGGIGA